MARSRMSRAVSPPVLAIKRCTSGQEGPTGSPSCWNNRGPSIPVAMLSADGVGPASPPGLMTLRESFVLEQPRAINPGGDAGPTPSADSRMSKESTQSFGAGRHRETAPTPLSVAGQKRVHIFQGNIVERSILRAQPGQELLHLPALTADGGRG